MSTIASSSHSDPDSRSLQVLLDAFGSRFSLDDIAAAYCQASQNVDVAGEILFAMTEKTPQGDQVKTNGATSKPTHVHVPKEVRRQEYSKAKAWRPKKNSISVGTISSVIGKEYVRTKPVSNAPREVAKPIKIDSKDIPETEIWSEEIPKSNEANISSWYFVPALGFLMFAVGINSNEKDFLEAFKRPKAILLGYVGQYLIKPLLGFIFGLAAVSLFQLPTPIGAGIMLVSCVSGAQLSNYATFLTDPALAPLSIVMTSLSTATAVLVTPMLSLLLIGKKLPVDIKGMISSILQVVIAPIAAGLLLNKLFPKVSNAIRPFLPVLSVLDTACCVGAPLALNINSVMSPFGATILLLITTFHLSAFVAGYFLTGSVFRNAPDGKALQRTLSYETGMQSSLLALALATKFFQDPLVGIPPAISTVVMSLMGFTLVMIWSNEKEQDIKQT